MDGDLPTARSIFRAGYRVHVWCKSCRHSKYADLDALIAAGKGDVPLIRTKGGVGELFGSQAALIIIFSTVTGMADRAFDGKQKPIDYRSQRVGVDLPRRGLRRIPFVEADVALIVAHGFILSRLGLRCVAATRRRSAHIRASFWPGR
jgi:hypothetical protein